MKGKYQLLCMSFDGDYVIERPEFESIEKAWEYNDDIGSKWYFYPFRFVIRGKSIKDTDERISSLIGKRIKTVQRAFERTFKYCSERDMTLTPDDYITYL